MNTIKILISALTILLISCSGKPDTKHLTALEGYWEIEKVIMPDGKKNFTVNETIDHFTIKGMSGRRTKVRPQFDGSFIAAGSEAFTIKDSASSIFLVYTLSGKTWTEELIQLSDDELVLKNSHPIEYYYKRHEPFSLK
jgi:hypothetical protein